MNQNNALYAGSFDPLTNGHLDLIKRAANICKSVTVGVIENPQKTPYFTAEERKDMIRRATKDLKNVQVDSFSGLLADYVNSQGFSVVLRGLRSNMDFEYELQMAHINARLYEKNVETVFLMTNPKYSFVSSSLAKEVHSYGGNIEGLVPKIVLDEMNKKRISGGK